MLVYLGKIIPEYAVQNYFCIQKNFPNFEIWFIIDDETHLDRMLKRGINVWLASRHISQKSTSRASYRNGFWLNTINRFLAMDEFHASKPDLSLLQIESDVILSKSFPMDYFSKIEMDYAFPLSSPDVGVASTLWCKNPEATRALANFSLTCISTNEFVTDTDILGMLAKKFPELVLVLRSGPDYPKAYRNGPVSGSGSLRGSSHPINDLGVFDASTLGIHLCGSDPRNTFGISRVFSPLPHHFMNLETMTFQIEAGEIYLTAGDEIRKIFSLHNHSKEKHFFRGNISTGIFPHLYRRDRGEFSRFSLPGFLECIKDYLQLAMNKACRMTRGNTQ